ncbi:MAG: hypothetical protein NC122_05140 [Faecalibacterium sp.]|nr:hypothetical protein [Ruminococcus sp.]MCM1391998.1 hypothetical protein [Ruminococcus sp.]MCM1485571.1 hypothetical protein [Faecalibacterium sp.]
MQDFQAWMAQYWRYVIGLIGVCIVAFFIFRAAMRSYKRYYKRYHEQEAGIKHLLELKEKYQNLTTDVIADAPDDELLEGVALSYQLVLQKEEDMTAQFNKLPQEKQFIYVLDVFVQDKSVETFFRENGKELTEIIVPALEMLGMDEAAKKAEKVRLMFDENDDTTSISKNLIEQTEKYFEENEILTKIKLNTAKYIKENAEKFI